MFKCKELLVFCQSSFKNLPLCLASGLGFGPEPSKHFLGRTLHLVTGKMSKLTFRKRALGNLEDSAIRKHRLGGTLLS